MTHLSPEQLIDAAEGRGTPTVMTHTGTCEVCRASVDELRETLALAHTDSVPEPSPLFWDHLSARVGAAVRAEAGNHAGRARWIWRWGPVSALAAAVLVVALVVMPRGPRVGAPVAGTGSSFAATESIATEPDEPDTVDDASWLLMSDLSQELTADEAGTALPSGPGTADQALRHLTDAERAALVDIIRDEIAHRSAPGAEPSGE